MSEETKSLLIEVSSSTKLSDAKLVMDTLLTEMMDIWTSLTVIQAKISEMLKIKLNIVPIIYYTTVQSILGVTDSTYIWTLTEASFCNGLGLTILQIFF